MIQYWDDEMVVAHGEVYYTADLPGFLAIYKGEPVALATLHIEDDACEMVTFWWPFTLGQSTNLAS
jgi:hypothetical protein